MAGIDYTIPGQIKGIQIEPPENAMARAMQMRNMQQTSQINELQLQEAQRVAKQKNALASLDPSSPEYFTQLQRIDPNLALSYQKAGFEAKSAKTLQQKHESELFDAKLKQSRNFLEGINPNSPTAVQEYLAWHKANHADPILGPILEARGVTENSARARIEQAIKTNSLSDLIEESKLGIEKFTELSPAFRKAEKEQIDQEYSDYLNTPGNPVLSRLQFVEARKRQNAAAAAPNVAALAPATNVAPAANALPDLMGNVDPNIEVTQGVSSNVYDKNRPVNKTGPLGNKQPFTGETPSEVTNKLPSIMWPANQANVGVQNNLGVVPAFTTANVNKAPAPAPAPAPVTAPAPVPVVAKTAVTTTSPDIDPIAAALYNSPLPGDKAKADAIQRVFEARQKSGVALSEIAQMQDDRAKAIQRGDRKSANEISARISKLIKTDEPPINPAQSALISKAILDGRLDPAKVNSRNMAIVANTLEMDPTANLKELNIDSVSAAAASKALATQSAKTLAASNEANEMIPIVRNASAKVDRSKYPDLNAIQNAIDKKTGGTEIVTLNTAINALVNSYARAINPTGVATVSDKNHARDIINSAYSKGQLNAILDTMQQEMIASKAAPGRAAAELKAARSRPVGAMNRNVPKSAIRSKADEILGR